MLFSEDEGVIRWNVVKSIQEWKAHITFTKETDGNKERSIS
jgi:hypothetical protein